jgi:hypothetical protein
MKHSRGKKIPMGYTCLNGLWEETGENIDSRLFLHGRASDLLLSFRLLLSQVLNEGNIKIPCALFLLPANPEPPKECFHRQHLLIFCLMSFN